LKPLEEIWQYNAMVRGMQNYYRIATDMKKLNELRKLVGNIIL